MSLESFVKSGLIQDLKDKCEKDYIFGISKISFQTNSVNNLFGYILDLDSIIDKPESERADLFKKISNKILIEISNSQAQNSESKRDYPSQEKL